MPKHILLIADPKRDVIVAVTLDDEGRVFRVTRTHTLAPMHDGRASSIEVAIAAHGGHAAAVIARYHALPDSSRKALLAFRDSLQGSPQ